MLLVIDFPEQVALGGWFVGLFIGFLVVVVIVVVVAAILAYAARISRQADEAVRALEADYVSTFALWKVRETIDLTVAIRDVARRARAELER